MKIFQGLYENRAKVVSGILFFSFLFGVGYVFYGLLTTFLLQHGVFLVYCAIYAAVASAAAFGAEKICDCGKEQENEDD